MTGGLETGAGTNVSRIERGVRGRCPKFIWWRFSLLIGHILNIIGQLLSHTIKQILGHFPTKSNTYQPL